MIALRPADAAPAPETIIERRGCAGFILLNRPGMLNALTLGMVRSIAGALDDFERDASIHRIVIMSAGGRAFCAGGDLRALYERGRDGDIAPLLAMWRQEYQLNWRLKTYPKPIVALVDGIVMGGGVGLCAYSKHIIVSERLLYAMPEVGIGFIPDIGATWFLPRLPHRFGVYLALTGARIDAGDTLALGLASAFASSARFAALAHALESAGDIELILARFTETAPKSRVLETAAALAPCLAGASCTQILAALERSPLAFAQQAALAMQGKSPTSQAIVLRQMQLGASLSFDEALKLEFRIVSRIAAAHDFYEGVRAAIIDKDGRPHWRPENAHALETAAIDAYFAPLGDHELDLPELLLGGVRH